MRYAQRAPILAYDLRNEPRFKDLVIARYPLEISITLQTASLLAVYGEQISPAEVEARRSDPFWLPTWLSAEKAYWCANALVLYDQLMAQASLWLTNSPRATILDYLSSPEPAERWAPLLQATDQALGAWLSVLTQSLRKADATTPMTVGYNDYLLATLPANKMLDFISWHSYIPAEDWAPSHAAQMLAALATRLGEPAMLGEFGWPTSEHSAERVAKLEVQTLHQLRSRGFAGALKWMLNDVKGAEHTPEGSFGLFNSDTSPKASAYAFSHFTRTQAGNSPADVG